jgi:hypothetical protein
MNDTELDELLNAWKAPDSSASWQDGMRARLAKKPKRTLRNLFPGWRFVFAGAAVAAVALVLVDNSAFPQVVQRPPYTVESEITLYQGWPDCRECWAEGPKSARMTSYNAAGNEQVLSWSVPGSLWEEFFWTVRFAHNNTIRKIHRLFGEPDPEADEYASVHTDVAHSSVVGRRATLVDSGCRTTSSPGQVLGEDVVLNYPTVVTQVGFWKRKVTLWMAPQLSCFALRATVEAQQTDGSWTLMSEKRALNVTLNR